MSSAIIRDFVLLHSLRFAWFPSPFAWVGFESRCIFEMGCETRGVEFQPPVGSFFSRFRGTRDRTPRSPGDRPLLEIPDRSVNTEARSFIFFGKRIPLFPLNRSQASYLKSCSNIIRLSWHIRDILEDISVSTVSS